MMGSQESIGLIILEYRYCETRKDDQKKIENTNTASYTTQRTKQYNKKKNQPLIKRIAKSESTMNALQKKKEEKEKTHCCKLCSWDGYSMDDCPHWSDSHCSYCQCPGHTKGECWHKNKDKRPDWWRKPKPGNPRKRPCPDKANITKDYVFNATEEIKDTTNVVTPTRIPIGLITHQANNSEEQKEKEIIFDESKEGQYYNFENYVVGYTGDDLLVLYYNCISKNQLFLFHLIPSYSSYFGGKKGISRNKTSFFLLMTGWQTVRQHHTYATNVMHLQSISLLLNTILT